MWGSINKGDRKSVGLTMLATLAIAFIFSLISNSSYGAIFRFDFRVFFSNGLAITNVVGFDYGTIGVAGTGNNNIVISPIDGAISCSNTNSYQCPDFGRRGSFLVVGSPGDTVSIACQRRGDVTNGIDTYRYNLARALVDGNDEACGGLRNPIHTHTLTGSINDDTVYMGARLRLDSTPSLGVYTTTPSNPLRVRVLFQ